jgi:hypothetical protein
MKVKEMLEKLGIKKWKWYDRVGFVDCHSSISRTLIRLEEKEVVAYESTNFATLFLVKGKISFFTFYKVSNRINCNGYNYRVGEVRDKQVVPSLFKNPIILNKDKWKLFNDKILVDSI